MDASAVQTLHDLASRYDDPALLGESEDVSGIRARESQVVGFVPRLLVVHQQQIGAPLQGQRENSLFPTPFKVIQDIVK